MDSETERLCRLGLLCFRLTVGARGQPPRKKVIPPKSWPLVATCDTGKVGRGNALAIATGVGSDLFVVDVDPPAMAAFALLEAHHGFVNVPRVSTCSGGIHLYFGFQASVTAGLLKQCNQTKLEVGGEKVDIDTRGEGGFILAPPTTVPGLGQYAWIAARIGDVALEPLPPWLMAIVNGASPRARRAADPTRASSSSDSAPINGAYEPSVGELAAVTNLLRTASKTFPGAGPNGDDSSTYSGSKRLSAYIVSHHYLTAAGGRRCPYDGPLHESDNFALIVRGCRVFYKCFSPSCVAINPVIDPRGALGTLAPWLPGEVAFDAQRLYDLEREAAHRAAEAVTAEGPGDTGEADTPERLPWPVRNACRRDVLAVLNRFFFLARRDSLVYEVEWRNQLPSRVRRIIPRTLAAFRMLLRNVKLLQLELGSSLADWWLDHRYRSEVAAVTYMPGEHALYFARSDGEPIPTLQTLNKWPGFASEPDGGTLYNSLGDLGALVPIFRHLHYVWCRGLADPCFWLLGWLADTVQRPVTKSGVAIVADSVLEGAGKGILVHWFGKHVIGALDGCELSYEKQESAVP